MVSPLSMAPLIARFGGRFLFDRDGCNNSPARRCWYEIRTKVLLVFNTSVGSQAKLFRFGRPCTGGIFWCILTGGKTLPPGGGPPPYLRHPGRRTTVGVRLVYWRQFHRLTAKCWSCRNASSVACDYMASEDPVTALKKMGAEAVAMFTPENRPVFKVIRCPRHRKGRLHPILRA